MCTATTGVGNALAHLPRTAEELDAVNAAVASGSTSVGLDVSWQAYRSMIVKEIATGRATPSSGRGERIRHLERGRHDDDTGRDFRPKA